jgi:GxxExxY protein
MGTNEEMLIHRDLCYEIVGAAMEVHRALGPGFLERVYENALCIALRDRGLRHVQQATISVCFRGQVVGTYIADILVENDVILELKTVDCISDVHRAQTINYLKATGLRLALIINFARTKLEWERIVV